MRILFTGASSFSGWWFVQTLAAAGHELVCPLASAPELYTGVRARRVNQLPAACRLVPRAAFGSERFLELAQSGHWDLLCHHGAETTNYRSPDFDPLHAARTNALNLPAVLAGLREQGLKAVVLTGTFFENDEGVGDGSLPAFSPYGLSKALTFQVFRFYCRGAQVPLGKFVMPNPFGPHEDERFTAHLMREWREGKPAAVRTPLYVRDNIPADLLAQVYLLFAAGLSKEPLQKINPSGYVETQGDFALRVAREVRARTNWACDLDLASQEDFSEPMSRFNPQPARDLVPAWNEPAFWDNFVTFYTALPGSPTGA